jgi:hypothetical protein
MTENIGGIVLNRAKSSGLVISRVPQPTKDLFTQIAEESFSDDFGQMLKWCLEQALEYQQMKVTLFNGLHDKLDTIIDNVVKKEEVSEDGQKTIQLLDGKTIMKGGNQKR